MNSLLSVLHPSPCMRDAHRRLAAVLPSSKHKLLDATAEVWEPGEDPEPRPPRKTKPPPRKPSGAAAHDLLLIHLTDKPQTLRELMRATGIKPSAIHSGLHRLVKTGLIRNLARNGTIGQYVRVPTEPRGVFDV